MPTRFRVEVIEQVALPTRSYRITLEIEKKGIPPQPPAKSTEVTVAPAASADFQIAIAGKGRLTIEKVRPLTSVGSFPLEDTYEYAVEFTGKKEPGFHLIAAVKTPIPCPNPPKDAKPKTPEEPKGAALLPPELAIGKDNSGNPVLRLRVADPPDPDAAHKRVSSDTGVARWRPIAHVFPGTDASRKALVIGGIHGSEPHGARVANQIVKLLGDRGPAKLTTIVVPVLFPRTHADDLLSGRDDQRNVPSAADKRLVEPNRNFPKAGQSYATARDLGRQGKDAAELVFCADSDSEATSPKDRHEEASPPRGRTTLNRFTSHRLLPETGLLLALIEEYGPSLIVALHAHMRVKEIGNSSGIFVDPRPEDRTTNMDVARGMVAAFDAKYATARKTIEGARPTADAGAPGAGSGGPGAGTAAAGVSPGPRPTFVWDPLTGNRSGKVGSAANVLYATTAAHAFGTSLGDWGPIRVSESFPGVTSPRGNRFGVPVFTIECPQTPNGVLDADSQLVESTHAENIFEVLLEGPRAK